MVSKSVVNLKVFSVILIIGLLSACVTPPMPAPASTPTAEPATPTQTFTAAPAPTDTTSTPTETALPTSTIQSTDIPATETIPVSFAKDVLPILKSRCVNCHGGNKTEKGLVLSTYAGVMKGSEKRPVVNTGIADGSLLVELILSQEMPKRGPKLTPSQVQLIIDWINQGALDN